MNVVLVSDHETHGGAAQSASRLAVALCRSHTVTRLVRFAEGGPHPWRTIALTPEEPPWRRHLYRVPRRLWKGRFPRPNTPAFVEHQLASALRRLRPDVVNLHNLHGGGPWGWGPRLAAVAARFAPVVWTLHDMWSFTGRCAYSHDCRRFETGCGAACPTPHEAPALPAEKIAAAWAQRASMFAQTPNLVAVAPSRWLAEEARRGAWANRRIEVIPYGVPTAVFHPLPRSEARRALGLPEQGRILLLAAVDLGERRKGADMVPLLGSSLPERPFTLLTMGRGSLVIPASHVNVRALGWIDDDTTKALAYSAADALLHPAPVDNLPNVVLEALACGTPAIALPIGGVPELVRPGVTGWLADAATPAALGVAVGAALEALERGHNLRASCRQVAEAEYPLALQGRRYDRLFGELQKERRGVTIQGRWPSF